MTFNYGAQLVAYRLILQLRSLPRLSPETTSELYDAKLIYAAHRDRFDGKKQNRTKTKAVV